MLLLLSVSAPVFAHISPGHLCSLLLWRLPPQVEGQPQRHVWKDLVTGWTLESPFHHSIPWCFSMCPPLKIAILGGATSTFKQPTMGQTLKNPILGPLSMAARSTVTSKCQGPAVSPISPIPYPTLPNWIDPEQVKTTASVTFSLNLDFHGIFAMPYQVASLSHQELLVKSPTTKPCYRPPQALRNCAMAPTQDRHGTSETCNQSSPSTAEPSKGGAPQWRTRGCPHQFFVWWFLKIHEL